MVIDYRHALSLNVDYRLYIEYEITDRIDRINCILDTNNRGEGERECVIEKALDPIEWHLKYPARSNIFTFWMENVSCHYALWCQLERLVKNYVFSGIIFSDDLTYKWNWQNMKTLLFMEIVRSIDSRASIEQTEQNRWKIYDTEIVNIS